MTRIEDKLKELEYEIKQLEDRINDLKDKILNLLSNKEKLDKLAKDPSLNSEEIKQIEDSRRQYDGELKNLKGRSTQLEDRLKLHLMKLEAKQDQEGDDTDEAASTSSKNTANLHKTKGMQNELGNLKKILQDLEEKLRGLRKVSVLATNYYFIKPNF